VAWLAEAVGTAGIDKSWEVLYLGFDVLKGTGLRDVRQVYAVRNKKAAHKDGCIVNFSLSLGSENLFDLG
jgi:hypothetical protein